MKQHKCVENGGCKAADCDNNGSCSKSQAKRIAIQKGDDVREAELLFKSRVAKEEFQEAQITLAQAIINGLDVDDILVEEYRRTKRNEMRLLKLLMSSCND